MKVCLCSEIKLGCYCNENISIDISHKWRDIRFAKFNLFLDSLDKDKVSYLILLGTFVENGKITESELDEVIDYIRDHSLTVVLCMNEIEKERLDCKRSIPDNLILISEEIDDMYTDDNLALLVQDDMLKIQIKDSKSQSIPNLSSHRYSVSGGTKKEYSVGKFEPTGYEDSDDSYGYLMLECNDNRITKRFVDIKPRMRYENLNYKTDVETNLKDLLRKIYLLCEKYDKYTFLRLCINGKTRFGEIISTETVRNKLSNLVFNVDVFDNTTMDIDESDFDGDISLRAEFVRLTLQDDTLSESERNRVIGCGWNALSSED